MPSTAKFTVNVIFENGPRIESLGRVEPTSYLSVDKDLCRCSGEEPVELYAGNKVNIERIVITADRYAPENNSCPANGPAVSKRIKVWLGSHTFYLTAPFVMCAPFTDPLPDPLDTVKVQNEMPLDVKVSFLVMRKSAEDRTAPPDPKRGSKGE